MCVAFVRGEDLHVFSMSNDSNETNLVGRRRGLEVSDAPKSVFGALGPGRNPHCRLTFESVSDICREHTLFQWLRMRGKPTKTWQTGALARWGLVL